METRRRPIRSPSAASTIPTVFSWPGVPGEGHGREPQLRPAPSRIRAPAGSQAPRRPSALLRPPPCLPWTSASGCSSFRASVCPSLDRCRMSYPSRPFLRPPSLRTVKMGNDDGSNQALGGLFHGLHAATGHLIERSRVRAFPTPSPHPRPPTPSPPPVSNSAAV